MSIANEMSIWRSGPCSVVVSTTAGKVVFQRGKPLWKPYKRRYATPCGGHIAVSLLAARSGLCVVPCKLT